MPVTQNNHRTVDRFGWLYIAAAIMEYVPTLSFRTAIFVFVMIWFTGDVIFRGTLSVQRKSYFVDILIAFFVFLAIVSIFWATAGGVEFEDWGRGVVPFLFLAVYFTIDKSERAITERLVRWLYLAAWVWIIRIVFELIVITVAGSSFGVGRLTSVINDSVIPYGIVTVPFLIAMFNGFRSIVPIALLGIFLMITILTGYRSQTLIILTQLFILLLIWGGNLRKLTTMIGALLLSVIVLYAFVDVDANIARLLDRFAATDANFESSRLAEWGFALDKFSESPIWGSGIGLQVPAEITFAGSDFSSLSTWMVIPDSAGYVHSITAYLLMTLGGLGLATYFSIIGGSLRAVISFQSWNDPQLRRLAFTAALSLIGLLVYFQVQAAFRMIQMNLAMVALFLILENLRSRNLRLAKKVPLAGITSTPSEPLAVGHTKT